MFEGRHNLIDRPFAAASLDVDNKVVKMRVGNVAVKKLLSKLAAAAVNLRHSLFGVAFVQAHSLHQLSEAIFRRGDQANGKQLMSRKEELSAATDKHGMFAMRRRQDDVAQVAEVFCMRHDLAIHPIAEDIVDPTALGFVDKFQHSTGEMEAIGNLVEQIFVKNLPAESPAECLPDFRSARPRLARDRDVLDFLRRWVRAALMLDRPIFEVGHHCPDVHLPFGGGDNFGVFVGLLFHDKSSVEQE